jgi:hypothetical protein
MPPSHPPTQYVEIRIFVTFCTAHATVDTGGSQLLGHDPGWIHYLTSAEARLGSMRDIEIVTA